MARLDGFWVIISGATPTAFRSPRQEDLLPTLKQLQRTQPDTTLRWFFRGRFWESPEAEREAFLKRRRESSERNREWRPGGDHKDPRAKYKVPRDQKRARFKARQWRDHDKGPGPKAEGQPPRPPSPPADSSVPPSSHRGPGAPLGGWSPPPDRPKRPPFEKKFGSYGPPRPYGKSQPGGKPFRPKGKSFRPPGSHSAKPSGPGDDTRRGPGNPLGGWKSKPKGGKPFGSRPGGYRPGPGGPKGRSNRGFKPRGPKRS